MRAAFHVSSGQSVTSHEGWVVYPAALFAASWFPLATNESTLSCPLHLIIDSSLGFIKASVSLFVLFMLNGGSHCCQTSWSDPLTQLDLDGSSHIGWVSVDVYTLCYVSLALSEGDPSLHVLFSGEFLLPLLHVVCMVGVCPLLCLTWRLRTVESPPTFSEREHHLLCELLWSISR